MAYELNIRKLLNTYYYVCINLIKNRKFISQENITLELKIFKIITQKSEKHCIRNIFYLIRTISNVFLSNFP